MIARLSISVYKTQFANTKSQSIRIASNKH